MQRAETGPNPIQPARMGETPNMRTMLGREVQFSTERTGNAQNAKNLADEIRAMSDEELDQWASQLVRAPEPKPQEVVKNEQEVKPQDGQPEGRSGLLGEQAVGAPSARKQREAAPPATAPAPTVEGVRRGRDEEYGIDVEMKPAQNGYEITEAVNSESKTKKINAGLMGVYVDDHTLNQDGEIVPSSTIIHGDPKADISRKAYHPQDRQAVVDFLAEIEFARSTGDMARVKQLEEILGESVRRGKDPVLATDPAPAPTTPKQPWEMKIGRAHV